MNEEVEATYRVIVGISGGLEGRDDLCLVQRTPVIHVNLPD
jgi:hypothetical protein